MALIKRATEVLWDSSSGGQTYSFVVAVDSSGSISVRDIVTPTGYLSDSFTRLPDSVLQDIERARNLTVLQAATTVIESGTTAFTAQTSKTVTITTPLENTSYFVDASTSDSVPLVISDLTTSSFVITAATTYTGTVSYSILQKALNSASANGQLVFTAATGPTQSVAFSTAQANSQYQVRLIPDGFYAASITSKTAAGFTVALSFSPRAAESFTVSYEIFA